MAKGRSPNYPVISLADAIERVRKVYDAEHTHKTAKEVVAKNLGYNTINGASLRLIGALRAYDLLQGDGDGLRVTDDAVAILELPKGDPERTEALRRAAFGPQLFSELHEEFGDNLPSDQSLRHNLIKRKFLPKAADEVVRLYRDNLQLVNADRGEYNADEMKPQQQTQEAQQPTQRPNYGPGMETHRMMSPVLDLQMKMQEANTSYTESLDTRISPDCKVRLYFDGPVTQEGIEKLKGYLEHIKDGYPSKQELGGLTGAGTIYDKEGNLLSKVHYRFLPNSEVQLFPQEEGEWSPLKNPEITLQIEDGRRFNLLKSGYLSGLFVLRQN